MAYTRVNWQDGPQGGTPLSAANLNVMDVGLAEAHELLDASTPSATPLTLMRRDSSGRARVASPAENTHIANKGYVDNLVDNLGTSDSTPNTVMRRDANGRAKVASPAEPDDIARKDTIRALVWSASRVWNPTSDISFSVAVELNQLALNLTLAEPSDVVVMFSGGDIDLDDPNDTIVYRLRLNSASPVEGPMYRFAGVPAGTHTITPIAATTNPSTVGTLRLGIPWVSIAMVLPAA